MLYKVGHPLFRSCLISRACVDHNSTMGYSAFHGVVNDADPIVQLMRLNLHLVKIGIKYKFFPDITH